MHLRQGFIVGIGPKVAGSADNVSCQARAYGAGVDSLSYSWPVVTSKFKYSTPALEVHRQSLFIAKATFHLEFDPGLKWHCVVGQVAQPG